MTRMCIPPPLSVKLAGKNMTRFIFRALLGLPGWLLYFTLMTPLVVLGFPLVAVAAAFAKQYYPEFGGNRHWLSPYLWLYDNAEDGIDGGEAIRRPQVNVGIGEWRRIVVWSAWRNSVGNARWTKLFGMTVDHTRVALYFPDSDFADLTSRLKTGPYLARQGARFELRVPWSPGRFFWIGWRIAQQTGITPGVGFAFQPWGKV